jgi:hypothetical protein
MTPSQKKENMACLIDLFHDLTEQLLSMVDHHLKDMPYRTQFLDDDCPATPTTHRPDASFMFGAISASEESITPSYCHYRETISLSDASSQRKLSRSNYSDGFRVSASGGNMSISLGVPSLCSFPSRNSPNGNRKQKRLCSNITSSRHIRPVDITSNCNTDVRKILDGALERRNKIVQQRSQSHVLISCTESGTTAMISTTTTTSSSSSSSSSSTNSSTTANAQSTRRSVKGNSRTRVGPLLTIRT